MTRLLEVLSAFIRFAHTDRGIPSPLTDETLDAVSEMTEEYLGMVSDTGRPTGTAALMESTLPLFVSLGDRTWRSSNSRAWLLRWVEKTSSPRFRPISSPVEDIDWSHVPRDLEDKVAETLKTSDRSCGDLLDVEYRTIVRRMIARVGRLEPGVFRTAT